MNAPEPIPGALLLPIDSIIKSPTNPRKHFNEAALKELAASIAQHGVLQPILVRKWTVDCAMPAGRCYGDMQGMHEIVCGERRWRASQIAGRAEILAIIRELTDLQVLEIQVVENLQREDVHPIEEAEGYERLIKWHGYSADTLAEKVGKSRAYIYARLKLTALAPVAREAFFEGKLTASTALLIARIPVPALQIKALQEITQTTSWQKEAMSYRAAQEHIQSRYMLDLDRAPFKPGDAALIPKAGSCVDCPKRSGNDLLLFADVEDADVCTDPDCFNDKREANFERQRAIAEKAGQEVITGEEARKMMPNGVTYHLDKFNLQSLNDLCPDDAEGRTFREILGKSAPAVTLVENVRDKIFTEVVDTKLLAAALKKVGIAPKTIKGNPATDYAAEREKRKAETIRENAWRAKLFQAVRVKLGGQFAESKLLAPEELTILAVNLFKKSQKNYGDDVDDLMVLWGHKAVASGCNDEDQDKQIDEFSKFLCTLSAAEICLFLVDMSLIDEVKVTYEDDRPVRLLAQAARLSIDVEALREPAKASKVQSKTAKPKAEKAAKPANPPTPAAQAAAKGATPAAPAKAEGTTKPAAKKPKAKTTPAPALPANEPAAPVKTTALSPMAAWPFPLQSGGQA